MNEKIIEREHYKIHLIKTNKFRENVISIFFRDKSTLEDYKKIAALSLLNYSSKNYKTKRLINIKKEELYNEYLKYTYSRIGDTLKLGWIMSFIDPKLIGDDYLSDTIKFGFDILNNPNFNENDLDAVKNRLINIYRNKMDKPANFAYDNAINLCMPNSLYSNMLMGREDELNKLTLQDINNAYNSIINNSMIDIYVVGNLDNRVISYIDKYNIFSKNKYNKFNNFIDVISRNKVIEKKDKSKYEQAQIVMIYNFKTNNYINNILFNEILGGGSLTSKLYENLRNKNSLCYSVHSSYERYLDTLEITTAVNNENVNKAIELIKLSVDEMKNNIKEDELNDVKNSLRSYLDTIFDNQYDIIQYFDSIDNSNAYDLDTKIKYINDANIKDINNLYDNLKLNTIYVLGGNDTNE